MKLILKILKLFAIIIITVSVILFTLAFLLQEKVASIVLKSINKNISEKLEVGSFNLSLLRRFPKASLDLKEVLVLSSSDFNSSCFPKINTDTLLTAREVSVEFKITDLINGIYKIERVSVRAGKINLYTDTAGRVNYDISFKNTTPSGSDLTIDLKRINLSNIRTYYNNQATKLIIKGLIKNGKFKSKIAGDIIDFSAQADMQITSFQLYDFKIEKPVAAGLDLILQSTKKGILFNKGTMTLDKYDFNLSGLISSENMLDLNLAGHNIDIAKIRDYLPEKLRNQLSAYDPSGILVIESKIKGYVTRTSNPNIEINFLLKDGHIKSGNSRLSVNELSLSGYFSNGIKNGPETSSLSLKDIKATLGTSHFTGAYKMYGFKHPAIELTLNGKIIPEEFKDFFDLKDISSANGSVDLNLKMIATIDLKKKYSLSDLIDLKPEADLVFNSFSLGYKSDKFLISHVNGHINISNSIKVDNFQFTYKDHKVSIDGEFINLPEWLTNRPVQMIATGSVFFNRLDPEQFFKDFTKPDSITKNKIAFTFIDNIILDLKFKIDNLNYKTFSSENITGTLNYKPGILTIKSLNMKSLNGTLSGNGFIFQSKNKSVIARGSFNVVDIDINNAFKTFHNFGQKFIIAENLNGTLSGSLSLLLPMDSMLIPQVKSITAEGKYTVVNGSLINFEPVKELSSFIKLSELEKISFEKMENDFFIRNNYLYIPQMEVKSSAADLSINGKHSFENAYEYHIKMLLSEFLSKKRKKNKNPVTEFGVIEDDGLGRTSLLLKVTGKGEDIKVAYDMKAATNQVKNNIKAERQNLKTILNQEYGWFKTDSASKTKAAEKKSRFKISWDEQDTIKKKKIPPATKKTSPVKIKFDNN